MPTTCASTSATADWPRSAGRSATTSCAGRDLRDRRRSRTSRVSDSGTQLTLAGLDHLVGSGITEALLYVAAENTAATAMYERLGFTVHRVDRAYVGEVAAADR